jgi:hypothetical protein
MSGSQPRMGGVLGGGHPAVLGARLRRGAATSIGALVALGVSLGIAIAVPKPSLTLTFAGIAGVAAIIALVSNPRLEVTVTILVLYLGLLDGPVKLISGGHETATVFRDVLIAAVSVGALSRLWMSRRAITLPPLTGWVLLFAAIVLAESFNPHTGGLVKALGGWRQQLEFVPFFFFAYALMRSRRRLRQMFLILGVLALANGAVATYQTKLGLGSLAAWGPGYKELVYGSVEEGGGTGGSHKGITGRAYVVGGVSHVRPPALGKDAGFGGTVGMLALPGLLALLATWRKRRRWVPLLLCLGALLALVTGLGRLQLVAAVFGVIAFAMLSASAGPRVMRVLMTVLVVLAVAVPAGAGLVAIEAPGTFNRYASISPENASGAKDKKTSELEHLPALIEYAPFGLGLGKAGAAAGFGGLSKQEVKTPTFGSETQYNFLAIETGLPGVLVWVGLSLTVIALAAARLRRVADLEKRVLLAGVFAPLVAFLLAGTSGPITSNAAGAYFWFMAGTAGYWIAGRRPVAAAGRRLGKTRPAAITPAYQ